MAKQLLDLAIYYGFETPAMLKGSKTRPNRINPDIPRLVYNKDAHMPIGNYTKFGPTWRLIPLQFEFAPHIPPMFWYAAMQKTAQFSIACGNRRHVVPNFVYNMSSFILVKN